jgi:hypothetical protein
MAKVIISLLAQADSAYIIIDLAARQTIASPPNTRLTSKRSMNASPLQIAGHIAPRLAN